MSRLDVSGVKTRMDTISFLGKTILQKQKIWKKGSLNSGVFRIYDQIDSAGDYYLNTMTRLEEVVIKMPTREVEPMSRYITAVVIVDSVNRKRTYATLKQWVPVE